MAVQSAGIFGPISGRVGDKIGYIRNGKQYWRNSPKKQNQASAEATAELNLKRLAFLSSYLFPFRFCYIKSARRINPDKLEPTPDNLYDFAPWACAMTDIGEWDHKFSKIIFCTGDGENFLDPKLSWDSNQVIKVTWHELGDTLMSLTDIFVCAPELEENQDLQEIKYIADSAYITIPVPIDTRAPHLYFCSFASEDGSIYQQYLGTLEPLKNKKTGSLWEIMD